MEDNILKNKLHYNQLYGQTQVINIVQKVRKLDSFLDNAIKTDTSWHGLYYGDFKNRVSGKSILELGCGNGLNACIMASLGADVTAIDISEASENIINQVNSQLGTNVRALTGDFYSMDFETSSFDFIVGKAFLHHLNHDLEMKYLQKTAAILRIDGEARFLEPAMNSKALDALRWITPVPGRPSKLNKKAFTVWKDNDPHPERDNSTKHFIELGSIYFNNVETVMIGSLERFCRILPMGNFHTAYRRWAHRVEPQLPKWFRYSAARSQLIMYRYPK